MVAKEIKSLLFAVFVVLAFSFAACNQPTTAKNQNQAENNNEAKVAAPYPHAKGWALPIQHGEQFKKLSIEEKSKCFKCHHIEKAPPAMNCKTCHNAFPHPDEFMNPDKHKPLANSNEGKCTSCHRGGPTNPINEKCAMCHQGELKTELHWKDPAKEVQQQDAKPAQKSSLKTKKPQRLPSNK